MLPKGMVIAVSFRTAVYSTYNAKVRLMRITVPMCLKTAFTEDAA